jgi:hypothetical protein
MKNQALDSPRAKIQRANHHLEQIDIAIGELWAAESQKVPTDLPCYKMEGQYLIVFRTHSAPVAPSFSLTVGDFIHNTRSALDHLVYQLAILNSASIDAASRTSFPACLTTEEFKNASRRKIAPFISATALAEIEKLQPYSTGDGESDILWVLSQLDIIDKHRLLIVTQSKVRPTGFTITSPDGREATAYLPPGEWKPSEAGTELIRFDLSQAYLPPGEMHVKINTAMTVQIENSGLICDGMIIQAALKDCIQHAVNIIDSFGKMFFSE